MKSTLLVKLATITTFVVLLTGFIAYKAGSFNGYLDAGSDKQAKEEAGLSGIQTVSTDTPRTEAIDITKPDTILFNNQKIVIDRRTFLSSSKSSVMIPQENFLMKHPPLKIRDTVKLIDQSYSPKFSSSKSFIIIDQEEQLKIDSNRTTISMPK